MKEYKIIVKKTVYSDIDVIFDYLANELNEPQTAEKLCSLIETEFNSLRYLPLRFPLFAVKDLQIRKMPVKNYSVFYVVDEVKNSVNILNIIYNRRNWQMLI